MNHQYRNPWYSRSGNGSGIDPEIYSTDATPIEHAGCQIFERIKGKCWDVVRDGVCVSQRAGKSGALRIAEAVERVGYDGVRHIVENGESSHGLEDMA